MSDTVLTVLIMTAGTIICQILINRSNREKREKEDRAKEKDRIRKETEKDTRLEDRLSSIEAKLDEHNGYAQKFETVAERAGQAVDTLLAASWRPWRFGGSGTVRGHGRL